MTDFKLKYKIEADNTNAKRAFAEVDAQINKTGAGSTFDKIGAGLSSLAGPAAVAATAVATIGTAAVTATAALFNLTRQAADFGSEIYDASKKTGLSAETLSAMKFAADQSGSSLDNITGGIAKFAKEVGAAADGSEKAAAKLESLGIDPQEALTDLDAALAKVFQRIQEAPEGIERITLAQKAFGKSGADLLPFIDSFDGDLAGLTRRAKELGVTIDDEAAAAADAFGDQLDTLSAQMAGAGRVLGNELMPIFMEWATATSEWAVRNKSEISAWAKGFAGAVEFTASTITNNIDAFAGFAEILAGIANYNWAAVSSGVQRMVSAAREQKGAWDKLNSPRPQGVLGSAGGRLPGSYNDDAVTRAGGGRTRPDNNNEADRAERERIAMVKENSAIEIAEKQASIATLVQLEKTRFEQGVINEEQYVRNIREHEMTLSGFIIATKQKELDALQNNANEKKRLDSEIRILNSETERQLAEYDEADAKRDKDRAKAEEAEHKKRIARWNETVRRLQEIADAEEAADLAALKRSREQSEAGMATAPGTLYGGIMGGLGVSLVPMFDEATNAMLSFQERLQLVKGDINDFVGNAIGGMVDGLAQMAAAWLSTGEFSAKAALQMLSSVAFSIAAQAAIKAVFEAAEAVAAAARWDFVAAGLHSTAATMYSSVAVIAGAAGIGLALGARAMGGGKGGGKGSSSSSYSGSSRESERDMTPISRQNENTFISGRRDGTVFEQMNETLKKLTAKIDTAKAGDVFIAGMKQNPGAVGRQVVSDMSRNNGIATQMQRKSGVG